MIIQHVLKGFGEITDSEADAILLSDGIQSNWLRNASVDITEWGDRLTEHELEWHLNHFDRVYPPTGRTYADLSPFISTTAGVYERDPRTADILPFDPLDTAVFFATDGLRCEGFVFYGYVFVLERPSIPLAGFSEEVRSLISFPWWLPFHHEGEIAAKIHIPSCQLAKYEKYVPDADGGRQLVATSPPNPAYRPPADFSNVRGLAAVPPVR